MKLPQLQIAVNFISHLNKREKTVFYLAAAVVLLMFLDRAIIHPVIVKISDLDKEIAHEESAIKQDLRVLSQKNRILSEAAQYAVFIGKAKSEEEQITLILKEIESAANKTEVYLVDMKPSGLKTIGTVKKYLVTVNCEAQMARIVNFMYGIESSNKLLSVEKYEIAPKSKDTSTAKCTLTVSKIVIP